MENSSSDQINTNPTFGRIFENIWTSPRKTIRWINDSGYNNYVYLLIVLMGVTSVIANGYSEGLGDRWDLFAVLLFYVGIGALLGWIPTVIYVFLLSLTGKWIKGKADFRPLLNMTAYAYIPFTCTLGIIALQILFWGNGLFKSDWAPYEEGWAAAFFALVTSLGQAVLSIWTLVIFIIGISEVQKFSIWKAILNALLPIFFILFVVFGLVAIGYGLGLLF